MTDALRLGFVCVQNAGRSQMATAFAEELRAERGLTDRVDVVTGGTDPTEEIHPVVVDAMAEVGVDLSDREPRAVTSDELDACDVVATMGCSTLTLDASTEERDWALPDPHGRDIDEVRDIRETVRERVAALFDDVVGKSSART
ncbi:MAG: low molecular weight phosphatase family protein [Halolamina sp.]